MIKPLVVWFLVADYIDGTLFAVAVFDGGWWVWTMIITPTLAVSKIKLYTR